MLVWLIELIGQFMKEWLNVFAKIYIETEIQFNAKTYTRMVEWMIGLNSFHYWGPVIILWLNAIR